MNYYEDPEGTCFFFLRKIKIVFLLRTYVIIVLRHVRNRMVYIETARRLKSAACKFIEAGRRMSHSLNKTKNKKTPLTQ